ncbi:Dcp1p-Dcp2p decapping enzyme complex alpha subunit [Dimargaris cristalligena]|uniref:mRNA-capping enzyme subunit alpha n=1 Tax=Dimargaris cristalligena TaxID=215637 RepID=A0A4P9ZNX0_9FUNG|nr:Dcp1p-Dcp2p decapping enzyme complex alpha subunit [Dimargaris cristalligena]RKP34868.1 mRNA capping enzyme, catalytic domain-containing protein [Dimargaris cristalligena]|eukprot:RKP34868.1 mRNA capping enzyme, catalytic domain-containing protein [Dimargaris cristalligena]
MSMPPTRPITSVDGVIPDIPGSPVDLQYAKELRTKVAQLLQLNHERFPGAQPVSFLKEHIDTLKNEDFFVCEKSDGVRCLVYAVFSSMGHPETYLIDRKNIYRHVPQLYIPIPSDPARPKFHNGTLFDGELIIDREPNGRSYLRLYCFDLLAVGGKCVTDRPLTNRLGYLNEHVILPFNTLMKANPSFARSTPFTIILKYMQFSYGAPKVLKEEIPKLHHKNDGLIFTSVNAPYVVGTTEKMLKWKAADENSVDFRVNLRYPTGSESSQKPMFVLSVWQGGKDYTPFAEMAVTDADWRDFRRNNIQFENRIVEVCYDPHHNPPAKWKFMRFREDKPHGNHASVVDKILQSIRDGVEEEELIKQSAEIRTAYKARVGQ